MTITGEADWDSTIFTKLKAGDLTQHQAAALWEYTDGYKVQITASSLADFNPIGFTGPTMTDRYYQSSCTGLLYSGTADPSVLSN